MPAGFLPLETERLAGAATPAEAQAVLARFLPQHNRRFAKAAADAVPAWRAVDRTRLVLPLPKHSPFLRLAGS